MNSFGFILPQGHAELVSASPWVFNSAGVQTLKRVQGDVVVLGLLLFFFTFSFNYFSASNSPGDSSKAKYAISDPRNPNCPCHKYQKQAEKEYKRYLLLNKQVHEKNKSQIKTLEPRDKKQDSRTGKRMRNSFHFKPTYKKHKSANKIKRPHGFKSWFRKDISKCFHW